MEWTARGEINGGSTEVPGLLWEHRNSSPADSGDMMKEAKVS